MDYADIVEMYRVHTQIQWESHMVDANWLPFAATDEMYDQGTEYMEELDNLADALKKFAIEKFGGDEAWEEASETAFKR